MIQKQNININFANGVNTKTDPKQLSIGQFLALNNSVFTVAGELKKRNGNKLLTSLPTSTPASYLTTLNEGLVAVGQSIFSYNQPSNVWNTQGKYYPASLSTLPMVRNSLSQVQCDSVVAPNGLVCVVYTEVSDLTPSYKFTVASSTTGQTVLAPAVIPVASGAVSGSPRVFLLGSYFIIVFTRLVGSTSHLSYVTVSSLVPASTGLPANDIAASYIPSSRLSWDGVVFNNTLYVGYDTTSGGQTVAVTALPRASAIAGIPASAPNTTTGSGKTATLVSMSVDTTMTDPNIYISFYDSGSSTGYTYAVDSSLAQTLAATETITSGTILNLTSSAQNGTLQLFLEVNNSYGYDSAIPTNFIDSVTMSSSGTVGTRYTVIRSVGLASKSFIIDRTVYVQTAYESSAAAGAGFQPSYFLVDGTRSTQAAPRIVCKVAYSNGGGYLALGLPGVFINGYQVSLPYLLKDLIESQAPATLQSVANPAPALYTQTGINLASIDLNATDFSSTDIAGSLQLSGGFGWMYDGSVPIEENFFLWPDSVEVTSSSSAINITGDTVSGSKTLINLSSTAGVGLGMSVAATGVTTGSVVTSFTATTITMSLVATSSHTAEGIALSGNINGQPTGFVSGQPSYYYQAIYSWTDKQGDVHNSAPSIPVPTGSLTTAVTYINTISIPTLRLTYKTNVTIRLYRWSVANQNYYEVTSIQQPVLNSTTSDFVTIVDPFADASIVGNNLIYTTGGVVEDVNSPASSIITLFDTRAWKVDAEDQNLLWYSKQIIESTPVEWSDLFTYYVAPNTGTVNSTGPITAMAPMDDKLVLFKKDAIYFINGTGPDNTGANSQYPTSPYFITSTVGCSNQKSVVLMQNGLMFQSDKGIWLLDRNLGTSYIGAPVEGFNDSVVTSAINVPATTQVRFTLDTGETLMYDYYYSQWGVFKGAPAVSSTIYQGSHTLLNGLGQVLQETPEFYLDGSNPVLLSFATGPISVAGISGYQRAYQVALTGAYSSPHKLVVQISYDFSQFTQQYVINPTNATGVYGSDSLYGQTSPYGGPGNLEQWRIQFNNQQCQSFQISLQEVYDPTQGQPAGAGFTMSNMNCLVGIKKATKPFSAAKTTG